MALRFVSVLAALLLLAACETTPQQSGTAGGEGGAGAGGASAMSGNLSSQSLQGTAVPGSKEDFNVNVGDRVYFAFDQSNLSPEARETLQRQAAWLKKYPNVSVTIEGHTDERGTREYNLALGERRAAAVKNYLVALGISPDRMSTISYGKERPAVIGSNEAAWAKNRRAVTVVHAPGA